MKRKIFFFLVYLILVLPACIQKEKTCTINGKVINRPYSTELRLSNAFVDFRSKQSVLIPIKDSSFTYSFKYKDIEAYSLVFEDENLQGRMHPVKFFSTNGDIFMELHPIEGYKKNILSGGKENNDYFEHQKKLENELEVKSKPIRDSIDILNKNDNFNSQMMKDLLLKLKNVEKDENRFTLYDKINQLYKSGEGLSEAAKRVNARQDSIAKTIFKKEIEHIAENISIPNYYSLIEYILKSEYSRGILNLNELTQIRKKFVFRFKNHPFTKYSDEVIWRYENIKTGGNYYDFTLPNLEDQKYTLSKEIKGKFALIDIWAPWCGPCISKSKEMIPVYGKYKDKGFTIVGVASKYEEINDVMRLLEKDKYPWVTLIDKPEVNSRINEHYGIEMAGGGCFLVDNQGKIVLVNPSVEEITEVLEKNL